MSEDREVEKFERAPEAPAPVEEVVKNPEPSKEDAVVPEVPVAVPTPVSVQPKKKPAPAPVQARVDSSVPEVEVVLKALTYQAYSRKSVSVAVVQDRLFELGHGSVKRDPYGWLSDGTVEAIEEFQKSAGLQATGEADAKTVEALMKGTKAKVVS